MVAVKSMSYQLSFCVFAFQLLLLVTVVVSFSVVPHNLLRNGPLACRSQRLKSSARVAAVRSNAETRNSRRKSRKKRISFDKKTNTKDDYVHDGIEIWRIYGLSVHPDDLEEDEHVPVKSKTTFTSAEKIPKALEKAITTKLRLDAVPANTKVIRRSLDARKKLDHPQYSYVVDIPIEGSLRHSLSWKAKSGKMEKLRILDSNSISSSEQKKSVCDNDRDEGVEEQRPKKNVVIVGMGPAGLFCALQIALNSNGAVRPILLDRGKPVDKRGQDIGRLIHRRHLDEESNFAFGEGGAGTWSDGKLTTRIGRNSETVRLILETLVEFGAPSNIL
jgi:hypothetical protein